MGVLVSGRRHGSCAALRWDDGHARYLCGLVAPDTPAWPKPLRWLAPLVQRLAHRWIAAGVGCDAHIELDNTPPPATSP